MDDPSLVAIFTMLTAIIVLVTTVVAFFKSRNLDKKVSRIEVNVDGRISALLEEQNTTNARIMQLTKALELSDTEVPPAMIMRDLPVDVSEMMEEDDGV